AGPTPKTERLRRRADLRPDGNVSARYPRLLFDSRRTRSLRTSAEAAGSNDLFEIGMDFGIRDRDCINHRDASGLRIFSLMKDRRARADMSGERTRPRVPFSAPRRKLPGLSRSVGRGAQRSTRGACAPRKTA